MIISSVFPTARVVFPGSHFSSYGFPFTYLRLYTVDLIGSGARFNLLNAFVDYFIWVVVALLTFSTIDGLYPRLGKSRHASPVGPS